MDLRLPHISIAPPYPNWRSSLSTGRRQGGNEISNNESTVFCKRDKNKLIVDDGHFNRFIVSILLGNHALIALLQAILDSTKFS